VANRGRELEQAVEVFAHSKTPSRVGKTGKSGVIAVTDQRAEDFHFDGQSRSISVMI